MEKKIGTIKIVEIYKGEKSYFTYRLYIITIKSMKHSHKYTKYKQ